MSRVLRCLAGVLVFCACVPALAHELSSVVLRLTEASGGQIDVLLKTPLARSGEPVAVVPQFEPGCEPVGNARVEREADFILRQWRMLCASALEGQTLRLQGLDPRTPDAVITAHFAGGGSATLVADRHDPRVVLQARADDAGPPPGLMAYLPMGIEHILLGADHLLFVFGLMWVVFTAGSGMRALVLALTAFTVAHSLTLALAVLGIWGLPARVTEVLIALSIVLLAVELATHESRRAQGLPPSLTLRKPWVAAFAFGLLHGFGFAGALADIGLPPEARGWALFLFNLGVEVGQLVFVAVLLLVRAQSLRLHPRTSAALTTALGGVALFWTLDRLLLWSATLQLGGWR
ncbi:MAG: HupE/UreJ family protein [Pseudomonadota bacterium]|mgnify:CR=1 FL=1